MKRIYVNGIKFPYKIDSKGNIFSLKRKIFLKHSIDKDGYHFVILQKNKLKKNLFVHRLVAQCYVENENPEENIIVNHKNEIKGDNRAENLEWCTISYNNTYNNLMKRKSETIHKNKINKNIKNPWLVISQRVLKTHGVFHNLNKYYKQCEMWFNANSFLNFKKWFAEYIKEIDINKLKPCKLPKTIENLSCRSSEFFAGNSIRYFHKSMFKGIDFSKENILNKIQYEFLHQRFLSVTFPMNLFGVNIVKPLVLYNILKRHINKKDTILNPNNNYSEMMIACHYLGVKYIGLSKGILLKEARKMRNFYKFNAKILTNKTKADVLVTICKKSNIKYFIDNYKARKYIFIIPKKDIIYNGYLNINSFKTIIK